MHLGISEIQMVKKNSSVNFRSRLQEWLQENRIPTKLQATFSGPVSSAGDWIIRREEVKQHIRLQIIPPRKGLETPPLLSELYTYLQREHMHSIRRALLQLTLRSAGSTQWALILQARTHSTQTVHAIKVLTQFLQRQHPEVICLHQLDTRPWIPFTPYDPPRGIQTQLKNWFGPEFIPLGQTGHLIHVLDWTPAIRHPYCELPARILKAIHPQPDDELLELHAGSSLISLSLHRHFAKIHALDVREISKQSFLANVKAQKVKNVQFHQDLLEASWIEKFFARKRGKFTVLLNPNHGEALPPRVLRLLAESTQVQRIVHISADLSVFAREIRRWRRNGFLLRKLVPLELLPESGNGELMAVFARDSQGVLQGAEPVKKSSQPRHSKTSSKSSVRFVQ